MKFQKMIDYVLENYPELDMTQDFTFYFDVDEYVFGDNSKTRPVMHIFIDLDFLDQWGDNPTCMYSGSFISGSEPNTWADYCLYVHSDVDKMKQTLINRLDIVMRDIKSVEKKIKKHAIAKSAGTYDAT